MQHDVLLWKRRSLNHTGNSRQWTWRHW